MRVVVGSHNPDKIAEIEAVLASTGIEVVRGLDWDDVEETGATLEENALLKARAVLDATGHPALADDTGLFVDALGGAPGVRTARFAGEDATYDDNIALMLDRMAGVENRGAVFRTVVALVSAEDELVALGELGGTIARERRGAGGFGYDPIFELSDGRTLAELSDGREEPDLAPCPGVVGPGQAHPRSSLSATVDAEAEPHNLA